MLSSECEDDHEKTGLITLIFGPESKMTKEEFIVKMADSKCSWIFDEV